MEKKLLDLVITIISFAAPAFAISACNDNSDTNRDSDKGSDTYEDSESGEYQDTDSDTSEDSESGEYQDTDTDTYEDSESGEYEDTETETYGDSESGEYEDTETETHGDSESGEYQDTDSNEYEDAGPDAGTDTDGDSDTYMEEYSIAVSDQVLDGLSTQIVIDSVTTDEDVWMIIHEDDNGSPGAVIGIAAVGAGTNTEILSTLTRPAVDGEKLIVMLHMDMGEMGVWEPEMDAPVPDDEGMAVMDDFTVTVPDETPAVRLTVSALGASAYDFTGVEPALYAEAVGDEASNQTLKVFTGFRYEIVNNASSGHPFELLDMGASAGSDVVLLSQSAAGSFESDGEVDWHDDGDKTIRFTVTEMLAATLSGYRCSIHVSSMRGGITVE